jgi:hypothetical protein
MCLTQSVLLLSTLLTAHCVLGQGGDGLGDLGLGDLGLGNDFNGLDGANGKHCLASVTIDSNSDP